MLFTCSLSLAIDLGCCVASREDQGSRTEVACLNGPTASFSEPLLERPFESAFIDRYGPQLETFVAHFFR